MNYFISSSVNYFKDTYPFIVKSLIDSKINPKNIYMIVGDCEKDVEFQNYFEINLYYVNYNSFEVNGLIFAADNLQKLKTNHIFLLHDTCLVGKNFQQYLGCHYNPSDPLKKLYRSISMNIGLYSLRYIKKYKDLIVSFKKYPKSLKEIQDCKLFFVKNEDFIFKKHFKKHNADYFSCHSKKTLEEVILKFDSYYHSFIRKLCEKRQIVFSNELELYKFQANFFMKKEWTIEL